MENLLEYTINAHGGIENWNKFESITARLLCGGVLWDLKQQPDVVQDIYVTANTRKQLTSHYPFINEDWLTSFEPGRIAIQKKNGEIIEEMSAPRDSFSNHVLETPWTQLQLAYFAGYAMWTYFNLPFIFKNPDYKVTELEPWNENGELYRRLEVTFPDEVATHSTVQTFYVDKEGLIKRHDYNVDISEGAAAAHYLSDYIEVQGIKIPTKRRVYRRLEDNSVLSVPLLVSIDLSEIVLK